MLLEGSWWTGKIVLTIAYRLNVHFQIVQFAVKYIKNILTL